jgi:hypothetical protein
MRNFSALMMLAVGSQTVKNFIERSSINPVFSSPTLIDRLPVLLLSGAGELQLRSPSAGDGAK